MRLLLLERQEMFSFLSYPGCQTQTFQYLEDKIFHEGQNWQVFT